MTLLTWVHSPIEQSSSTYNWACSKLETSRQSIPAYLLTAEESSFRPNAHLNILYDMIWVTIGRGALLRLVRGRLHPLATDTIGLGDDGMQLRSEELAQRCTKAATTVTEWIVRLQSRNLLARFSFTDLHTCSSAVIVLLLNAFLRPADHQLSAVTRGIDALHFMADGSTLAMNALRLVERLQQGIYQATGLANTETIPSREPSLVPPLGPHFSHDSTLGVDRDTLSGVPLNDSIGNNAASDVTPLDLSLFTDLEPFFLEHSDQDLNLFGFDGFESTFDLDSLMQN